MHAVNEPYDSVQCGNNYEHGKKIGATYASIGGYGKLAKDDIEWIRKSNNFEEILKDSLLKIMNIEVID